MGTKTMRGERRSRATAGFAAALCAATLLAGCGGGGDEGVRDGAGRVMSAGSWSVFELRTGDCLAPEQGLEGEVSDIAVVPCDEPHTQEVFALVELEAEAFPGAGELAAQADAECVGALQRDYGVSPSDGYFVSYLLPSFDSWNKEDDREITCVLVFPTSDDVQGSVLDDLTPPTTTTATTTTVAGAAAGAS